MIMLTDDTSLSIIRILASDVIPHNKTRFDSYILGIPEEHHYSKLPCNFEPCSDDEAFLWIAILTSVEDFVLTTTDGQVSVMVTHISESGAYLIREDF